MDSKKELFLDKKLKTGGFYELSIQVCPSTNNLPIKLYTEYLWSQKNVEGPFDMEFDKIKVELENIQHNGILNLENYSIPFMTYNIREDEPIETGFNWFDICFYSEAIEKIFGEEYTTWTVIQNCPKLITDFLNSTVKSLYEIYSFELAMIDFEISGQYYLEDLRNELENLTNVKFYVGKENINYVADNNKKM